MQSQAGMQLDKESRDQEFGMKQAQDDSQLRQKQSMNSAQRLSNESQERVASGNLDSRRRVFDTGMNYQYAALAKQRQLALRQALLNRYAKDL